MRLRPLLIGGAIAINSLTTLSQVDAGFYEGQVTTLNGKLLETGNTSAPLKLNGVFFNLEPLNNYYSGKNVSITVKWNSSSSFSVLSIVEKSQKNVEQKKIENKTIDLSIETKKIESNIHQAITESPKREDDIKGLTLKEKIQRLRGNLKLWDNKLENTSSSVVSNIFGDLSQQKKDTVPKTLKEKLLELRQLKN